MKAQLVCSATKTCVINYDTKRTREFQDYDTSELQRIHKNVKSRLKEETELPKLENTMRVLDTMFKLVCAKQAHRKYEIKNLLK